MGRGHTHTHIYIVDEERDTNSHKINDQRKNRPTVICFYDDQGNSSTINVTVCNNKFIAKVLYYDFNFSPCLTKLLPIFSPLPKPKYSWVQTHESMYEFLNGTSTLNNVEIHV